MPNRDNSLIYRNTIIIYARMLFVSFVGLFSSRFVLQALGASDYGLYNVVGGLIALFNFLGTAMSTTSRRYLNVEMGKKDGNLNKVFNICLVIHIGFALLILLIAETFGIWYINNVLNVADGKLGDAMFVFQISTIVACLGLVNIPYQSLIEANEKFGLVAIIDITSTIIRFIFIIILLYYPGNALRFYAILICGVSFLSFLFYHIVCAKNWSSVIKHRFYHKSTLYREIIIYNNYTAMGAIASIGRLQGTNMLVNFFYGTVVNAAFAIANQVESYVYMFVNKITQASNPQVAINYSSDNMQRVNELVEKNSRFCILIMICFFFPIVSEMDFILEVWLKEVPKGTVLLCVLTLTSSLARSFSEGTNGFIQASGKIKWFQIISSTMTIMNLPIGWCLFKLGYEPYWIVVCFIIMIVLYRCIGLYLMYKILDFNSLHYIKEAYLRPFFIIFVLSFVLVIYNLLPIETIEQHVLGLLGVFIATFLFVVFFGLNLNERKRIQKFVVDKIIYVKR